MLRFLESYWPRWLEPLTPNAALSDILEQWLEKTRSMEPSIRQ